MATTTDFSVPHRMSLGAFFIYFLKSFKAILNAVIIFLAIEIFKSEGGVIELLLKIAAMIGGAALIALIIAAISFFPVKFHVANSNLVYQRNLIRRESTTIPLNRIHSLRTRQGLFYRILGLRGIVFDTLASKGAEIELILKESDWQSLLGQIKREEQPRSVNPETPPVFDPSTTIRFPNRDLILDALCQNHLKGMVVLGSFAAVILNQISDFYDNAIDMLANYIETHFEQFAMSVAGIALIMVLTYIVSLILWLGKVILRYYDLSLTYDSKTLSFSHGLLSRMSSRFAHDKICTIRIKQNFLEKRFGLSTHSLKQALNSSAEKEEDNLKIYGKNRSGFFLGWWIGEDFQSQPEIINAKSGRGVMTLSLIKDCLVSIIVSGILWNLGLFGWITLPAIYLLTGIPKAIMTMRHSRISLRNSYLIVSEGRFAEINNYLKYANIEVVRIKRTPLSRFSHRVSLTLSTSGTTFTIRSLKQEQAAQVYELLLAKSSGSTKS